MAGNRKKSTVEQLEELKAKYAAQEQQLQAQKEELGTRQARVCMLLFAWLIVSTARLKSKTAKSKLIPRPKGQAGRGKNGYNLQKEMKLQNDPARFQRIEVCFAPLLFDSRLKLRSGLFGLTPTATSRLERR